jgi:hypothetical protein
MVWDMVFYGVVGLVILALVLGGISTLRRRQASASKGSGDEGAPIYASGVFSLIRKSPRETVLARTPSLSSVSEVLSKASHPVSQSISTWGTPEGYLKKWRETAELCIHNVEKGDKDGVQTYRYDVPVTCGEICAAFGGDTYVTREQLHAQVGLIPPFHLGCGCVLLTREAWQSGGDSAGWSPLLPVNGEYQVPDWRNVVPL